MILSLRTSLVFLAAGAAAAAGCGDPGPGDDSLGAGGTLVGAGGSGSGAATGSGAAASVGGTLASGGAVASGGGGVGAAGAGGTGAGGLSTGGSAGATGGAPATGGTGASAGSGGTDTSPPAAPEGKIPNDPYPDSKLPSSKDGWPNGLVSPTLESEHHNQPSIINGYLQITGNSRFSIYDISDPSDPKQLSHRLSPNDCTACGEAEGHQVSFAKYGDKFYTVTIQGKGVDLWDISDVTNPVHVKAVNIQGINFGDFTAAVWGVAWQGSFIYVGGTDTGVHVIDASDPENASVVGKQSNLGGILAGPVFPVGNVLVVTTPKDNAGVATLDISDPTKPILLKSIQPQEPSYIGGFHGHHAYLLNPIRVYDVLTNPTEITLVPGTRPGGYFEYVSFQDGFMFAGRIRPEPGATKIDIRNLGNMTHVRDIYGRRDLSENDDQFTVAVGNLLVMSDDQLSPVTNKYAGTVIAVHDANPDTTPPSVDTVIPKDGATGQAITTRVGVTFTDNVELATVDARSFFVRPVGGAPLSGKWGVNMDILHFDPDEDLQPGTTYEVVLPAGGVKDYVGNGLAQDFSSTFTTK